MMSEEPIQQNEKKVDESWKDEVEKERAPETSPEQATDTAQNTPPADFKLLLSGLGMQALMALGELPLPDGQDAAQTKDLPQAKYLIDMLEVLQTKTAGNLTAEEDELFKGLMYDLRMRFVAATKTSA